MKKIWYLLNADKKDRRVARLFVYENNGKRKAQLDLMSFFDKPVFSKVDVCLYVPQEMIVGRLCCQAEDAFIKQALKGKAVLPDDFLKSEGKFAGNLQIRVIWGGNVYDSFSCKEELPLEAEKSSADTNNADADNFIEEQTEAKQENSTGFWLDEDSEDGLDDDLEDDSEAAKEDEMPQTVCEPQKEGTRKIVELSVLEEEMIFRNFVHNSFLLHGYYNYGHLVIDDKDGRMRLGVPGNYYEKEKAVAAMFGFPDFESAKDEIIENGTFGYYFTTYA